MTDKQITIDGVNVKDCKRRIGKDNYCRYYKRPCSENNYNCIWKKYLRKEQENKRLLEIINAKPLETVDIDSSFEIEKLKEQLQAKEQECERLKWYLKEIRDDELKNLDIEWDEYETHCIDTEYTNIINLVEEALDERSPEDCRYGK